MEMLPSEVAVGNVKTVQKIGFFGGKCKFPFLKI